MSSTTVEFQCNIHRHSGLHRDQFMGKSLENLRCAHDISTCTKILVTMDQWDHVCSENPMFVVVGAVNTPSGLDATKGHAGVVPLPSDRTRASNDRSVKVCELFAGSFSGWTHVCRSLTHIGHDITVFAAIDHDEQCIQAYCRSHHVEHLVEAPNCAWGVHDLPEKIAICAKVEHHEWCHLLGLGVIDMMCISPPCPPWSWASAFEGLNREEGRLTLHAWGKIAILGPRIVCMEMVGAMTDHPHWYLITEFIKWTGYIVKWFKVASLSDVAPHKRERLILVAISSQHVRSLAPHRCTMWPQVPAFNLQTYQAIFDLGPPWSVQSFPSTRVLQMYLNPEFLPKPMHEQSRPVKRCKKDVESYRIRFPTGISSCIMANYSFAHLLPSTILQQRGLFGALLMSPKGIRFLALPEIVTLFTATNDVWLPADPKIAMHIMRNAITIPHAALGICNGLAFLNDELSQVDVQEIMLQVFGLRLNSGNMKWIWESGGVRFFRSVDSCDDHTQPMHDFFPIIVSTPTQKIRLLCEEGVRVIQAIQILTGPSSPAQLSMNLGDHRECRFALPAEFCMPREELSLYAGVPSVIMIDKQHVTLSRDDINSIIVLTYQGVRIIHKTHDLTVADVEHIIRSEYPEAPVPVLLTIGGEVLDELRLFSSDEAMIPCDLSILSFLRVHIEGNVISFKGSDMALHDLLHMMHKSQLHKLTLCMGWMLVNPVSGKSGLQSNEIQIIPRPNHLSLLVSDFIMFLTTRLFIGSVRQTVPLTEQSCGDKVFIHLKLWETNVWEGLVSADFIFLSWANFLE